MFKNICEIILLEDLPFVLVKVRLTITETSAVPIKVLHYLAPVCSKLQLSHINLLPAKACAMNYPYGREVLPMGLGNCVVTGTHMSEFYRAGWLT